MGAARRGRIGHKKLLLLLLSSSSCSSFESLCPIQLRSSSNPAPIQLQSRFYLPVLDDFLSFCRWFLKLQPLNFCMLKAFSGRPSPFSLLCSFFLNALFFFLFVPF